WSEMRRIEECPRRDFSNLLAQRVEHQIAGRAKDPADIRNLKALALHLQMANHRYRRLSKLCAAISNNLQRHRIVVLRRIYHVPAKTRQTFVSDRRRIDRSGQIVWTGNMKIRTRELG